MKNLSVQMDLSIFFFFFLPRGKGKYKFVELLSKLEIQIKVEDSSSKFATNGTRETCNNNLVFSYYPRYCSIRVTTLIYFPFFSRRPASALSDWAVNVARSRPSKAFCAGSRVIIRPAQSSLLI